MAVDSKILPMRNKMSHFAQVSQIAPGYSTLTR